jgi:1,4-dihydroxy-2-naphthoate octaprenyltransferase
MRLKDIFLHLRLPFSVFLMPIFLLALSQQALPNIKANILIFIILHIFIYPASNAFNSFCDKDEGSIGGLKNPPKVDKKLLKAANIFDSIGLLLSWIFLGALFAGCALLYVLVSRAYSWPGIRLKKYAIFSWLIVGFFQGAFIYLLVYGFGQQAKVNEVLFPEYIQHISPLVPALFSSLLLWSIYPITQVYQHEADAKAGDRTMSMVLGKKGTFVNTIVLFSLAIFLSLIFLSFEQFMLFNAFCFPVAVFTIWWFLKVIKNEENANFENTMRMNVLSSFILNVCFALFSFF